MGNHETSRCFYRPKYEAKARETNERAKSVLGNQPPIPGTTGARYVKPDEPKVQEVINLQECIMRRNILLLRSIVKITLNP